MMKKALLWFGLMFLCAPSAPAWRPAGWVYAWAPFVYDHSSGDGVWSRVGGPVSGERVTFRWVSVDGKKRSNDAPAIWP
jgi:hypothetical protein